MLSRVARRDACTLLSTLLLAHCVIIPCNSAFVEYKSSSCNEAFLIFGAKTKLDCRLMYSVKVYSMKNYSMTMYSMKMYSMEKYSMEIYSMEKHSVKMYSMEMYSMETYSMKIDI